MTGAESGSEEGDTRRVLLERNWLDAVVEESPLGILLVEAGEPERIRINRRARELFGSEFDPSHGRQVYAQAIRDARGDPIPMEGLASTRALRGETLLMEEQIVQQGRAAIPVMVSGSPVRDPSGRLLGAVVIFQDITHLKELERLREEWTAVVAHDLRQPLSIISMALQTLDHLLKAPDPNTQKLLSRAQVSAESLGRMIRDLLDFSRIEARRLDLEFSEIEAERFVRELVERIAPQITHSRICVEVHGPIPAIEADPGRLEQVLGNLLSNAAKYGTPETDIVVALEGCNRELLISITNHGPGLSPADLTELFQRFRRFDKSPSKGIGLGLYIAQGIVQAHRGRIWAESMPGRTTTFYVALPAAKSARAPDPYP